MKKRNNIGSLILLLLIFVSGTQTTQAQFNISIGFETAILQGTLNSISSYAFGSTLSGELGLTDKLGIDVQVGYLQPLPSEIYSSAYILPVQAGFKIYSNSKENGLYFHPQIGVHKVSVTSEKISYFGYTIPEQTITFTKPSYGLGIGYVANTKIAVAIRYNIISIDSGTTNYIGVRLGYTFL
jgi:hypothetical protein